METHHDSRPHPRVRASPEVGPGATVGTPGLGYPLLLCLGEKSFVVILNYVQRPDPCGPEALFAQQRSRTPWLGKVREHHVFREKQALSRTTGGSGPPVEVRTPAEYPDPHRGPGPPE